MEKAIKILKKRIEVLKDSVYNAKADSNVERHFTARLIEAESCLQALEASLEYDRMILEITLG